jgi:large subunit ribosomal protein L35
MPKLKTHSGTKDRVRVTKRGKLLVRRPSGHHHLEKKSAARKRNFAGLEEITGKSKRNLRQKLGV